MNNQGCKVRPEIINVNSNEPVFCSFSIKTSKCSGSCNNINDPFGKICVFDVVKDLNDKVLNLMSRTNETRHIKYHETCKCKCRLNASVWNNKQRRNDDKCRCECKEFVDKGICDRGYDLGEYLHYENCKCRKRLVDKLVEEGNENIDEEKLTKTDSFEHKNECTCYYTDFIVLSVIVLTIYIEISAYFVYYKYMNYNKENVSVYDYVYHAKNY